MEEDLEIKGSFLGEVKEAMGGDIGRDFERTL
jgi:hypothetical protein